MTILNAYIVPHPPLIFPEVGRGEERLIQKTIDSYRQIAAEIAETAPELLILTSPHAPLYTDAFHISPGQGASGNFARFNAPEVSVSVAYDTEFVRSLAQRCAETGIPVTTAAVRDAELDHASLIPLRFILDAWLGETPPEVVRIGLSGLPLETHFELGRQIAETAAKLNRRAVFIASGDLSHRLKADGPYGYQPEGPVFDQQVTEIIRTGDFRQLLRIDPEIYENAGECGLRSFVILAGALDGKAFRSELLSYEGPFGVGYAVGRIAVVPAAPGSEPAQATVDPYVQLAINSLTAWLKNGVYLKVPPNLPEEMLTQKAGAFVSLKKFGTLRGCIGTISPTTSCVATEIIRNAVSAGVEDPRFPPVEERELKYLTFSVDVLSAPEPIDSPDQLDVKRYGVIVSNGYRRGLLLPNLEGVDTIAEQVDIARQKAGIARGEPMQYQRFEVVRHL